MAGKLTRLFDLLLDSLAVLCGLLLAFIIGSVCLEVVMRYIFNSPLSWVLEITEYLLLFITFLGAAWLLRQDGHIRVDILITRLGPRTNGVLSLVSSAVGIVISLVFVYYGTAVTWDHYVRGMFRPTLLEIPTAPILAVIPFGGALLAVQFVRIVGKSLAEFRKSAVSNDTTPSATNEKKTERE